MTRRRLARSFAAAVALGGLAAGCARPQPALAPAKPPEVMVATPIVREVTDYEDFTGRTEAVETVSVRARVTGYLDSVHFKDGAEVKPGDLLFQIDPRPYRAEVDKSEAAVKQAEAHRDRLRRDFERAEGLRGRGISQDELDRITGDKAEADAAVAAAAAARELARQNLDFCRITAKIPGRLSNRYVDRGNLVKADDTILTTVVSLDPINAYFDVDDRTLLRIRRLVREGKVPSARRTETKVKIGLPDEDGHSLTGTVDFINNALDPGTGTLRLRAEVPNKNLLLSPGLFVRVRLPVGTPRKAVLVPEEALGTDQGQKYVYVVVDKVEKDKATGKDEVVPTVEYRAVKPGMQEDQYRVIESGVTEADRVVVSGLQRVRPGAAVTVKKAEKKEKPVPAAPATAADKPAEDNAARPAAAAAPRAAGGS